MHAAPAARWAQLAWQRGGQCRRRARAAHRMLPPSAASPCTPPAAPSWHLIRRPLKQRPLHPRMCPQDDHCTTHPPPPSAAQPCGSGDLFGLQHPPPRHPPQSLQTPPSSGLGPPTCGGSTNASGRRRSSGPVARGGGRGVGGGEHGEEAGLCRVPWLHEQRRRRRLRGGGDRRRALCVCGQLRHRQPLLPLPTIVHARFQAAAGLSASNQLAWKNWQTTKRRPLAAFASIESHCSRLSTARTRLVGPDGPLAGVVRRRLTAIVQSGAGQALGAAGERQTGAGER